MGAEISLRLGALPPTEDVEPVGVERAELEDVLVLGADALWL